MIAFLLMQTFLLCSSATREKISSAACPTPGCKGIGHVKGAKYSTHHSTFGCPYSLQNLNKDSCLVDRLSSNSMTEESDWSYASKQKLAVVKAIKGNIVWLEVYRNILVEKFKLWCLTFRYFRVWSLSKRKMLEPYDRHHKVSPSLNSYWNANNSIKHEFMWQKCLFPNSGLGVFLDTSDVSMILPSLPWSQKCL